MIDEADRDGDGEVNEQEFLRIMKKTSLYWDHSPLCRRRHTSLELVPAIVWNLVFENTNRFPLPPLTAPYNFSNHLKSMLDFRKRFLIVKLFARWPAVYFNFPKQRAHLRVEKGVSKLSPTCHSALLSLYSCRALPHLRHHRRTS